MHRQDEIDELNGFYTTEEDGRRLDLFPISEALRYRFPVLACRTRRCNIWKAWREKERKPPVYFDDIEKFGIWPETYEWVYEKGWLEDFIEGVLASPLIKPMKYLRLPCPGPYARHRLPADHFLYRDERVDLAGSRPPTAMPTWCRRQSQQGHFERDKAFLRGGIWKNFFSRYPESNWMHKRMLQSVAALERTAGDETDRSDA